MEPWIETFSGKKFTFDEINEDTIDIKDIAHALSLQCRFNGHVDRLYTVGEHCIRVSRLLPVRLKMAGLLHDAAETYIGDFVSPAKNMFPGIIDLENKILKTIYIKFGVGALNSEAKKKIDRADKIMVALEAKNFLTNTIYPWADDILKKYDIAVYGLMTMEPEETERQFLIEFYHFKTQEAHERYQV